MEEDNLTNTTSDFGELFEGETFETSFSEGLENGLGLGLNSTSSISGGGNVLSSGGSVISQQNITINSSALPYRIQIQPSQQKHFRKVEPQLNQFGIVQHAHENLSSLVLNNKAKAQNLEDEDEDSLFDGNEEDVIYFEKPDVKEKVRVVKDPDLVLRLKINQHLKQRGYRDTTLFPKVISKETLTKMIDPSLSQTNSVLFGPTYRAEEIHEEIERFYNFFLWTKEQNAGMSCEIKSMLMPMLVFFVRESYTNGFKPISNRLIAEFSKKILDQDKTPENCLIATVMGMMINNKNAQGFEDAYLKAVCDRRHRCVVSEGTFGALKKFLSKLKRTLLLNILSNHFLIELKTSQEVSEAVSNSSENPQDVNAESIRPSRIKRVLDKLRGSVTANLPSIKVYATNGDVASAAVSREGSIFAFGMSTSGIRICAESSAKRIPFSDEDAEDNSVYTPSIRTTTGHEGTVYGLAFHPRTKLLYSAGQDNVMRAWDFSHDVNIGCKAVYRGHFGPIWSMDISSSGQLIATASTDTTARLWVPERVDCVRIFAGHYFDVDRVKFHPNEAYVATGSLDKSVRLWSVSDGEMVRVMTGAEGRINALAFHKSGNYLVGGGHDNMIRVWDIREGELIAELPSLRNCKDLAFSGNMLAACFRNGAVQVWNLRNIVGQHEEHLQEDLPVYSVPNPYTVQCHVNSLVGLHYKDVGNLYGLGSHPIKSAEDTVLNSETATSTSPVSPQSTTTSDSSNSAPVFITLNAVQTMDTLDMSSGSDSPTMEVSTPTPTASSTSINNIVPPISVTSEDIHNCLEDADAENTNNTITSSDIELEFEVDEQILESFVDNLS